MVKKQQAGVLDELRKVLAPEADTDSGESSPYRGGLCVKPDDAEAENPELHELLKRAARALLREDRLLRAAFEASPHFEEYERRAAPGLSYWVFEHNLVYAILRDWITTERVVWDEESTAKWRVSERTEPKRSRQYVDLRIVRDENQRGQDWWFEVKWWNTSDVSAVNKDFERLKTIVGSGGSGFVITLWWTWQGDKAGFDTSRLGGREPIFAAGFPARVWVTPKKRVDDGWFVAAVFEVTP